VVDTTGYNIIVESKLHSFFFPFFTHNSILIVLLTCQLVLQKETLLPVLFVYTKLRILIPYVLTITNCSLDSLFIKLWSSFTCTN